MKDNETKTIYNMNLHDILQIDKSVSAMRVPGAWVYTIYDIETQPATYRRCRVPYNDEFNSNPSEYAK